MHFFQQGNSYCKSVAGGCHGDEMEDGDCHLSFGGSVPGDGSSSFQIAGAASREVGRLKSCLHSTIRNPSCIYTPYPCHPVYLLLMSQTFSAMKTAGLFERCNVELL